MEKRQIKKEPGSRGTEQGSTVPPCGDLTDPGSGREIDGSPAEKPRLWVTSQAQDSVQDWKKLTERVKCITDPPPVSVLKRRESCSHAGKIKWKEWSNVT
ncbi:tRNA-dihydrouridine(47) synthase, partial [Clarias magur]